jgi:transcriptional regulator with XRE-family HTH domain
VTKSIFTAHYDRLCAFLIQARVEAGMSQAALAKCLNRPQSFVSKYESKQRRLDVVEFLELAHCLHADGIDLMARLLDGWPKHDGVVNAKEKRAVGLDGRMDDGVAVNGVKPVRRNGGKTRANSLARDGQASVDGKRKR